MNKPTSFADLIGIIKCDLITLMDKGGLVRCHKRYFYCNDGLDQFIELIEQQLTDHGISYNVIEHGNHYNPNVPYKGTASLAHSSHYWIDIQLS